MYQKQIVFNIAHCNKAFNVTALSANPDLDTSVATILKCHTMPQVRNATLLCDHFFFY
ncbi:protein of unknown function (plasmid) [Vibrio harveyi]|nr:protein of unknown function [Vibrio harveyi]